MREVQKSARPATNLAAFLYPMSTGERSATYSRRHGSELRHTKVPESDPRLFRGPLLDVFASTADVP